MNHLLDKKRTSGAVSGKLSARVARDDNESWIFNGKLVKVSPFVTNHERSYCRIDVRNTIGSRYNYTATGIDIVERSAHFLTFNLQPIVHRWSHSQLVSIIISNYANLPQYRELLRSIARAFFCLQTAQRWKRKWTSWLPLVSVISTRNIYRWQSKKVVKSHQPQAR